LELTQPRRFALDEVLLGLVILGGNSGGRYLRQGGKDSRIRRLGGLRRISRLHGEQKPIPHEQTNCQHAV
jgi:hypothetical protein